MARIETAQSRCRFGIARCDITPPAGIYHRMWGAASHDRATGVHQPLTATAMVFQALEPLAEAGIEQVLVALDLCTLGAMEMDSLRRSVCSATALPAEQVAVTFSHTHSAGLMGLERVGLPGGDLIPPYLDRLSRQIANLIHDARRQVKPATITYGTGRCTLAAHRDYWDEASGQFVCGFNPLGQADDTVLVARVSSEDGPTIATVVNYACHPTTLGWENTLISPDYPGTTCAVVEQATGAPCVFLQGASGDLGPREGFVGDVRVAERNGRQLGFAVLAALEALPAPGTCLEYVGPVVSGATLGIWAHRPLEGARLRSVSAWAWRSWTVDLPYRADLPSHEQACEERKRWEAKEEVARRTGDAAGARASRAMVERMTRLQTRLSGLPRGSYFPMPVTAWRLGDAVWLAVEGEPYSLFQRALRLHCGSTPVVVMALTNGTRPGYLPDAATYGKGVYQESVAALEPGSLERLISAIEEQLAAWGIGVPRVQGPEMLREPEHR